MTVHFRNILCPIDFFPASKRAFEYAVKLAKSYGAALQLVHVVSPVVPDVYGASAGAADLTAELKDQAGKQLERFKSQAEKNNVPVSAAILVGDIDWEIRHAIASGDIDLVVMGTHGRRGFERWVLGSVTERLMRHCPVPLLVIPSKGRSRMVPPAIARMVITTDFSEGTADAMAYALSIAGECQSKVTLLHVVNNAAVDLDVRNREPLIRRIGRQLETLVPAEVRDWVEFKSRVETGIPWRVILKVIQAEHPGLLVMNVHGKGILERALIGSTADRVLRGAPCPVLLIPPMKKGASAGRPKGKTKKAPSGLLKPASTGRGRRLPAPGANQSAETP